MVNRAVRKAFHYEQGAMLKKTLIRIHWIAANQFGIDPVIFLQSVKNIPRFFRDFLKFRKVYKGPMSLLPCLNDHNQEGGQTRNEYFWQDLLVAQKIFAVNPTKHVDIGSRIDGFVAHVASFRPIEVIDVRPINNTVPNVTFRQADLTYSGLPNAFILGPKHYCDSLSCLHALEHFGLGRYGDLLDPNGYKKAICNMGNLLSSGGTLYLSTVVGKHCIEFNGQQVFDLETLLQVAETANLRVASLTVITDERGAEEITLCSDTIQKLKQRGSTLCLLVFQKQ